MLFLDRLQHGGWRRARPMRLLSGFCILAATLMLAGGAHAQVSQVTSGEPILRIESGQHGAAIRSIDTDAENRFAVTASDDKTVRVWSLPDGKLLRILRLPVDADNADVGKAYAVAMSPDGGTVAVGGSTAAWASHSIFLFDWASGTLKQRLANLPQVILHLAYSSDGRRLAASLGGSNGIRVFDASNGYRLLPSDTHYGDSSNSAMFDRAGRLVTASLDGFIRLYAANNYSAPIARYESKGNKPYTAAFSPDGNRVAVGYGNFNRSVLTILFGHDGRVTVLSGSNLTRPFEADTTSGFLDGGMVAVGWSQDGHFLFAGGTQRKADGSRAWVRRWSNAGRGEFVDMLVGTTYAPVMELLALKRGAMLFAHSRGFGVIGPNSATANELQGRGGLDLSVYRPDSLRVSADGGAVQIGHRPNHTYRFTLTRRVVDVDPPFDGVLIAPITRAPGLVEFGSDDTGRRRIEFESDTGRKRIEFESDGTGYSITIVPGTRRFVLSTNFTLRLIDQDAKDVWPGKHPVPGEARHVNITRDGRLVVAAYGDGTIRWHRLSDGKELLALFIHPDGQRWVAWTPQGYYDASVGADELIGWQVNHGLDQAPDFYPASRFRDRFYRPDVIQRVLQDLDVETSVQEADKAANRPVARTAPVSSLLTPVIEINDPKTPTAADRTDFQLAYTVRLPSPDDTLRVDAFVDGVKVPAEDRRLVDIGGLRAGNLYLTLPRRDARISAIAYNRNGASEPAAIEVKWRGPGTEPKLTLYVLAIGISDYTDKNRLQFAAKDADDFVAWAKTQQGGLYEKVITHPPRGSLRDGEATREAILNELDWIEHAVTNTSDVAMVFLAGHGITTPDQHYRFLPHDFDDKRVERTTIADFEIQQFLTRIGGKKIFFFDTCYSGNVLGGSRAPDTQADVDRFANELRTAENGIVVFTSSTGKELSLERTEWNNGAFTKALVEGLRGAAARPQVPVVMISDLSGYVSRRVRDLTGGSQKPMMAMPATVEDYPISLRLQ